MKLKCKDWRHFFYMPVKLDYTSTGERIPYDPLGIITGKKNQAQLDFHTAETQFKAMFGGSGLGKSMAAAREAELFLTVGEPYTCWIVAPTYELAEKEFKYIWEDLMITLGLQSESKYRYNVRSGDLFIRFPWGAEVHGKSEKDPTSLLGEAIHILILAEGAQLKKETYDRYLRRAVARAEGIVIDNTTPAGFNWAYDTFYLPWLHDDPRFWSGIYDVLENPYYSRQEYENARMDLEHSPEIFQEQFQGKFVQYSGLIYPEFDYKWHLWPLEEGQEPLEIAKLPKQFPLICLIDPHPAKETAILWALTDREECAIFADEWWGHALVSDVAEIVYQKSKIHKRVPLYFVIDAPDTKDIRTGINFIAEYRKELSKRFKTDMIVKTPNQQCKRQEVWGWVFKIKEKFKQNCNYGKGLKKPYITIGRHLKQTRYQLEHCIWNKERKIMDKDNDFLDLIKYFYGESLAYDIKPRTTIFNYKTRKYRGDNKIYVPTYQGRSGY